MLKLPISLLLEAYHPPPSWAMSSRLPRAT